MHRLCYILIITALFTARAGAVETVNFKQENHEQQIEGRLLVEALDGGIVLLAPDGVLWEVQPEEIQSRSSDERPFKPLTPDEMGKQLLAILPEGFRVHQTAHYTICYNTSQVYAQWCGSLYERLYRGFFNFWKTRGWTLAEPEFRLIALVFDSRKAWEDYARPEVGDAVGSYIGYYNWKTNRVSMYDLTGVDKATSGVRIANTSHINQILSRPEAERSVATIIHEATHQLAHNCGMQTRNADNPLWVSEGLAIYFESPDYKSEKGWRTIGAVNYVHLAGFQRFAATRPDDALLSLLADDGRFRDPKKVAGAYSESWALNYFLLNRHRDAYVRYLKELSKKQVLLRDTPEERIATFKESFGELKALDAEFLKYMSRLK